MLLKHILKNLYAKLPYKKRLFEIIRDYCGTPTLSIYQHLYFQGRFYVKLNSALGFNVIHYGNTVENDIFWKGLYGGWEKESLKIWSEISKDANTILDIGANTGIYSLIAQTINSEADIYAFEPISRVFDKLLENIKVNNYSITALQVAVSNSDGTATMYDTPSEHQYTATLNLRPHTAHTNTVPVEVSTVTLKSFIQANNLPGIDLIKIDVERHEIEVLQGFLPHLLELRPTILIEVIDNSIATYINKTFSGTDYLFFSINEKSGIAHEGEVITKKNEDVMNYLLCTRTTAERLQLV